MLGPALRMVVSLAIVLALMYIAARLLQRTRGGAPIRPSSGRFAALAASVKKTRTAKPGRRPARRRTQVEVLARQPLGKTASVAVVRVADRTLLLGVTDSAVQLLSEIDAALLDDTEVAADIAEVATPGAARVSSRTTVSVLDLLRERTVRRA
jgi:flagellar protein FliO/FliZ